MKYSRVLVVCLKANIKTWCDELDERFPDLTYTPVMGTPKQKAELIKQPTNFTIVNYDGVKRQRKGNRSVYDTFRDEADKFDLVIFDECYEISNHTNNRFKDIRRVIDAIANRIIMDGEPTAEGWKKLFGQFLMLDDGVTLGRDYYRFLETYAYQPPNLPFPKWVDRRGTWQKIQAILAKRAFIFTEDELRATAGLPEKVAYVLTTEMNTKQKKMYREIKEDWELKLEGEDVKDLSYTMEKISKGRQLLDGFIYLEDSVVRIPCEKEKVLEKLLSTKLAHKKKIVIFAAFRESLKIIGEVCDRVGRESVAYFGGLSLGDQAYALNAFQEDDSIEVFICSCSCGVGLNELVVSNVAIYYSNSDKRRDRAQSEKRQIRPTQKADQSYVFDLVTPKSYDSIIYKRLQDKENKSMMLLSPKDAR